MLQRPLFSVKAMVLPKPFLSKLSRKCATPTVLCRNNNGWQINTVLNISHCCFAMKGERGYGGEAVSLRRLELTETRDRRTAIHCGMRQSPLPQRGSSGKRRGKSRPFQSFLKGFRFSYRWTQAWTSMYSGKSLHLRSSRSKKRATSSSHRKILNSHHFWKW